jgi:redox-regulated HSP33 family molecular chaperone
MSSDDRIQAFRRNAVAARAEESRTRKAVQHAVARQQTEQAARAAQRRVEIFALNALLAKSDAVQAQQSAGMHHASGV